MNMKIQVHMKKNVPPILITYNVSARRGRKSEQRSTPPMTLAITLRMSFSPSI